jgi:hypothetical protein
MTPDPIKKKLNDLDTKLSKLTLTFFAYQQAMLQVLAEAGLTNQKKFKKILDGHKKQFGQILDDAEFLKMMAQLKKKWK